MVTDFSDSMVEKAKKNLAHASSDRLKVEVSPANALALTHLENASVDRYIANLCLQLCADADEMLREARRVLTSDGIAGFTIWGRPEFSGKFSIRAAVDKELGLTDGSLHPNFTFGTDLNAVRARFHAAGFSKVVVWPFLCVLELWSGESFADFYSDTFYEGDVELRAKQHAVAKRLGDEWLAKGFPIGLETYIILARP
ncbi:hypothetical protein PINS_up018618 [Pythium insidiosum]|nr:hypothetical protein PINS_up018618 [Pythium insidiosum]